MSATGTRHGRLRGSGTLATRTGPAGFIWSLLLFLAIAAPGCSTKVGAATVVVRPATRIPDRVIEDVTGEYELMEGMEPEGDTLMLLMRAYW